MVSDTYLCSGGAPGLEGESPSKQTGTTRRTDVTKPFALPRSPPDRHIQVGHALSRFTEEAPIRKPEVVVSTHNWVSYVSRLVLFVTRFHALERRREGVFIYNSQCLARGWHRAGVQLVKLSLNFMGTVEPPNSTNFIHA